ncbi:MAG: ABC transporter permease [Eubacteriaceae bacterium]|nr:ABC transporter permease [Eubacteriaceae bacterium]
MNRKQLALIKKDIKAITSNKQIFSVMFIMPLALTIVLPSILVIVTMMVPEASSDYRELLDLLPVASQGGDERKLVLELMLNKIIPGFFLMIPIMASSVMAASSFVGEKEKHTLETLLYSPLTLDEIFRAKILASFSVGMIVSFASFFAMLTVLEAEIFLLAGYFASFDIAWLVVMLLLSPALCLIAIAITVRGSAKAQTIEEAQQLAVFLVFPIIALVIGQFAGVIMINAGLLSLLGVGLAVFAAVFMKGVARKFTYERVLR